jgi:hypothetical protein
VQSILPHGKISVHGKRIGYGFRTQCTPWDSSKVNGEPEEVHIAYFRHMLHLIYNLSLCVPYEDVD